jgi:hypothetical protein
MKDRKVIVSFSILFATIFIAAQFAFKSPINGGVCSPYLGAPKELMHPAFQFTNYGFPIPFVTVVKNICLETNSQSYEWLPIGLGVDSLLLALIAYPIWSPPLKRKKQQKSPQ